MSRNGAEAARERPAHPETAPRRVKGGGEEDRRCAEETGDKHRDRWGDEVLIEGRTDGKRVDERRRDIYAQELVRKFAAKSYGHREASDRGGGNSCPDSPPSLAAPNERSAR